MSRWTGRRSRPTPPSTRRCATSGWASGRRNWKPRSRAGWTPRRRRMRKKTPPSGATRAAKRCRPQVGDKKRRAEKIRAAKAELEAEARAAAEAERQARAEEEKKREAEGRKKPGRPAAPPSEAPDPKAQKNPRAATRGPHHEDQGRLHPRLQRAGGCGRRGAGDRRSRPRRQRDAGAECAVAAVAGVGQNDPHMWKSAKSALGLFLEDLNLVRSRLNAADEPSGPADREARISEAALHHTAVPQRS